MSKDLKLGADTHIDPLNRLPQTVLKTVKTAGLCYLERPTPASTSSAHSTTWKMTDDSKLGADTNLDPLNPVPQTVFKTDKTASLCYLEGPTPVSTSSGHSTTCKMIEDSKLGANTHFDPLNRLVQTVFKTDKTASLCYLERPTPIST